MEVLEDRQFLSALVWTDKLDYAPGSTAYIYGSGYDANEFVTLTLDHVAGSPVGDDHVDTAPWTIQADTEGLFSSSWIVNDPDAVNATYLLTATGLGSGLFSETIFTDKTDTASGEGHMSLTTTPSPILPGSAGNTLTFNFSFNPDDEGHVFADGSVASVFIPAGWTAPQASNPAAPGYVTVSPISGTAALGSISGSAATGWTININFKAKDDDAFVLTYTGVTAPVVGTYTFTTTTAIPGGSPATLLDGSSPTLVFLLDTSLTTVAVTGTYGSHVDLSATLTSEDGAVAGRTINFTLNGLTVGSAVTDASGVATLSNASLLGIDAGSYASGVVATFVADSLYGPSSASAAMMVNQATLTASAVASSRGYDGTSGASVTLSDNRLAGDEIAISYISASFADKHVGVGKVVTVSGLALSGTDAANYVLASNTLTATANITAATLAVTATASNRIYDGTSSANVTLNDDRVAGDDITFGYTASFADKNVGAGKLVTVSGLYVSGPDAANYSLASTTVTANADIAAATLTVTATALNKVYDGTTAASVSLGDNRVTGDSLSFGYTAAFSDRNVGAGKLVTVSALVISGTDAGNYMLSSTTTTATANITGASLSPAVVAANKVYDGTSAATLISRTITGTLAGDDVNLVGGIATFDNKNVGVGKLVTATGLSLSGTDAGNYILSSTTATTSANITAASINASLNITITAANKVYDGTTTATLISRTITGTLAGDDVSLVGGIATFDNKNAGVGKLVTATGLSLGGTDAGNYILSSATATTSATISVASLIPSITAASKIYDGSTAATISSRTLAAVLGDDDVSLVGGIATFFDKNVGENKPVTATGLALNGKDAGNYVLSSTTAATTASIRAAALSLVVTASGVNKVYDGTVAATVTLSDNHVAGDDLIASYTSAVFTDKNVGTGKLISVSGVALSGADAGNYSLASATIFATANITPAAISINAIAQDKIYDGTTSAIASLTDDRIVGDDVTAIYTFATFADKNAGDGKVVTVTGISLTGADAANYSLASSTALTTASITRATLTISAAGVNKVYDTTTTASVILSDDRAAGDLLAITYATASFADKNVGDGKIVTVTGITLSGDDAANYLLASDTVLTAANITPAVLTATIRVLNKVYDGSSSATITSGTLRGVLGQDLVGLTGGSASFASSSVGTTKKVIIRGIRLAGPDARNYVLSTNTITTTARIVKSDTRLPSGGKQFIRRIMQPLVYAGVRLVQTVWIRG